MPVQQAERAADPREVLVETWAANDAMNQLVLAHLDPRAWREALPVPGRGGRTIAAAFAHLRNCRLNWLRRNAPHLRCPAPLDPYRCTMTQAKAALKKSAAQCGRMLADALSGSPNRQAKQFSRDAWTRTWPAGATMFAYMFAHEAHHRGQILMLAHQLGYRVPPKVNVWNWDKLWKEQGFKTRPR
jgi:uncharacterized damage-inducible protein DinB